MFIAKTYNIMIGAPSDIEEEVQTVKEVINEWNYINAELHHTVLLPLHWSISAYPCSGEHPQKILDRQIVNRSDLLICIFGSKLGTPTDTDISGSVEEITEHLKAGKNVMIFFRNNLKINSLTDVQQAEKLLHFMESIKGNALFEKYSENNFKSILRQKLQLFLNDTWLNPNYKPKEIKEDVTIILNKTELSIPYNGTDFISVSGIELDKCDIRIEDNFYAYASTNNGEIEINAYKVGTTKVIVSYGQYKAECTLHITPINDFCGNPILQFGKTYLEVKNMCNSVIIDEMENAFTCREGNILHYYLFNDEKLTLIVSHVKNANAVSHFLDATNSMNERYKYMTRVGNNICWYQEYKKQFYIASVENKQNKDWCFFYSPSKELIEKNIEQYKIKVK